jgi:hypothetical protein
MSAPTGVLGITPESAAPAMARLLTAANAIAKALPRVDHTGRVLVPVRDVRELAAALAELVREAEGRPS